MFDTKNAEQITKEFVNSLPVGLRTLSTEVQTLMEQFLKQWLSQMSLVTREEFEIQTQVLAKTRLKLELLEKNVAELESQLKIS